MIIKYIIGAIGSLNIGLAIGELTHNYLAALVSFVGIYGLFLAIVIPVNRKKTDDSKTGK
jgi:hypothetical protein